MIGDDFGMHSARVFLFLVLLLRMLMLVIVLVVQAPVVSCRYLRACCECAQRNRARHES